MFEPTHKANQVDPRMRVRKQPIFMQRSLRYPDTERVSKFEKECTGERMRLRIDEVGTTSPICLFYSSCCVEHQSEHYVVRSSSGEMLKMDERNSSDLIIDVTMGGYDGKNGTFEEGLLFLIRTSHPHVYYVKEKTRLSTRDSRFPGFGHIASGEKVLFSWVTRSCISKSMGSLKSITIPFLPGRLFGIEQMEKDLLGGFVIRPTLDLETSTRVKLTPISPLKPCRVDGERDEFSKQNPVCFRYLYKGMRECKMDVKERNECPFCGIICKEFNFLKKHLVFCHSMFGYGFSEEDNVFPTINVARKPSTSLVDSANGERCTDNDFCFSWVSKRWRIPATKGDEGATSISHTTGELRCFSKASEPLQTTPSKKEGHQKPKCGEFPVEASFKCNHTPVPLTKGQVLSQKHPVENQSPKRRRLKNDSSLDFDFVEWKGKEKRPMAETRQAVSAGKVGRSRRRSARTKKRIFFHSKTCQRITDEELKAGCMDSDDNEDFEAWSDAERRGLDEFIDVTEIEKQFMHMWNSYVHIYPVYGDIQMPPACANFARVNQRTLSGNKELRQCFVLFLVHLFQIGLIDQSVIVKSLDALDCA